MAIETEIYDYVDASGTNRFKQWLEAIGEGPKATINARLREMDVPKVATSPASDQFGPAESLEFVGPVVIGVVSAIVYDVMKTGLFRLRGSVKHDDTMDVRKLSTKIEENSQHIERVARRMERQSSRPDLIQEIVLFLIEFVRDTNGKSKR